MGLFHLFFGSHTVRRGSKLFVRTYVITESLIWPQYSSGCAPSFCNYLLCTRCSVRVASSCRVCARFCKCIEYVWLLLFLCAYALNECTCGFFLSCVRTLLYAYIRAALFTGASFVRLILNPCLFDISFHRHTLRGRGGRDHSRGGRDHSRGGRDHSRGVRDNVIDSI